MKNKLALFSFALLTLLSSAAFAETINKHVVVAPQCLLTGLNSGYKVLSSNENFSILETDETAIDQLREAKNQLRAASCGGFMDITKVWKKSKSSAARKAFFASYTSSLTSLPPMPYDYKIQYTRQVNQLISQVNPVNLQHNLSGLTNRHDRYSKSRNGVSATDWIREQVENLVTTYHRNHDVTISTIETGDDYLQPSVVVKIGNGMGHGIVIGAHIDTPPGTRGRKPGADDDGSGSATVLEVAQQLIASGMDFKKPIYLVWYAATEDGLVGSQQVVESFQQRNIPIDAVLQLDMTGYAHKNDLTMWLISDNVNKNLTDYLETLITTYVKKPVQRTLCGFACSDHISWNQQDIPVAMAFESDMKQHNPNIHGPEDTMDKLSIAHMTDYTKLAIAFAVELAEPLFVC